MATLTSKTHGTLVSDFAAATQGASAKLVDFTIGSVLRAVADSSGAQGLWLQGVCYQVLQMARLATAVGEDVDTWVADFMPSAVDGKLLSTGVRSPRLPSRVAVGTVTFARATASGDAYIPVGTQVMTLDGTQVFVVIADPSNNAYQANLDSYLVPDLVNNIDVPVNALTAGKAGNVLAGTVTLLRGGIPGIDTVTNALAFDKGLNEETDTQLKARFPLYIQSLRAATPGALGYAIVSTQQGLEYTLHENKDSVGQTVYGMVTIYVDDGSGDLPTDVLNAVIENVSSASTGQRAAGVRVGVFAAEKVLANIGGSIATAEGYDHNSLVGQVQVAIVNYINNLGLENTLHITRLPDIAYDVSPGVINATAFSINGGVLDLIPDMGETIKSGTIAIS